MDLGCLDMGCIEKKRVIPCNQTPSPSGSPTASAAPTSKHAKIKGTKEGVYSNLVSLNKNASQIRKPPHRKTSPLNWFPRQKVDSYLKRKIKLLQEVDGMSSTLDETLGDSNPHYSRVLREKIAVREAAQKAMEARKVAMVEASWCRILKAARIDTKQAEEHLMEAEKASDEAFQEATSIGVILYDTSGASQKQYSVETSASRVGGSNMHTVRTSFETAFEVDKQVASAVKAALIKLANCPSMNKDEFKELLRKISQNPDNDEKNSESSSKDEESDTATEMEVACENKRKCNITKIEEIMVERLRCLQEDELESLATIVATCGLNAALEEAGNQRLHTKVEAVSDHTSHAGPPQNEHEAPLPSLDKFLVKRLTRLEREVLEAKTAKRNGDKEENDRRHFSDQPSSKYSTEIEKHSESSSSSIGSKSSGHMISSEVPDLGSILVKHTSKLEREIKESKTNSERVDGKGAVGNKKSDAADEIPSLDKFLVKHVSKLEKEVQEAKDRQKNSNFRIPDSGGGGGVERLGKENIEQNKNIDAEVDESKVSLGKVLVKPIHRLEKMKKMQESSSSIGGVLMRTQRRKHGGGNCDDGLDKILVKHVSKLEKEKMAALEAATEEVKLPSVSRSSLGVSNEPGSLDHVLVRKAKCGSTLERKETVEVAAARESDDAQIRHSVSRKEAREKELQQAWGGLSLGNSIRPHLSRLQRDKASCSFKCKSFLFPSKLYTHTLWFMACVSL
ncbi:hypothetical protein DM860_003177 [Cuscuta australis]|uniref:Uncharacterized protein n=1 Tax=Cuscuta australis TaxID=267555 RepID=A0A328D2K9_9ASTE|nr:hypothetical protein DM860_003177 [Cuscuta australis]